MTEEKIKILVPVDGSESAERAFDKAVKIAGENFQAFLEGRSLQNEVDFVTGYRKKM